jgi:hypothetical protein
MARVAATTTIQWSVAGSPMTFHGGGEDGKELLQPEFGIITEKWMAENAIL